MWPKQLQTPESDYHLLHDHEDNCPKTFAQVSEGPNGFERKTEWISTRKINHTSLIENGGQLDTCYGLRYRNQQNLP